MNHSTSTNRLRFAHSAFGLTIDSFLPLPAAVGSAEGPFDVEIRQGAVAATGLEQPTLIKPLSQANAEQCWFSVPGIGRFLIQHGNQVVVEPDPRCDEASLVTVLTGSVFKMLLMQRNELVWKGTGFGANDQSVVILGASASGKSTLAAKLQTIQRPKGNVVCCDDVVMVNTNLELTPGWQRFSLWPDSCEQLQINTDSLPRVRPQLNKYSIGLAATALLPAPLTCIYVLMSHNQTEPVLEPVRGIEKFQLLLQRTDRMAHRSLFGGKPALMQRLTQIAQKTRVVKIIRPQAFTHLTELAELINKDMEQKQ